MNSGWLGKKPDPVSMVTRLSLLLLGLTGARDIYAMVFPQLGPGMWLFEAQPLNFHLYFDNNMHFFAPQFIPKQNVWTKVEVKTIKEDGKV